VAHKGKMVGVGTVAIKISEEHVGGREAPEVAQIDEILIKVSVYNLNPFIVPWQRQLIRVHRPLSPLSH